MSEIIMHRDPRDVWPEDVPRGTFDIIVSGGGVGGYPGAQGHILFVCPNGISCGGLIGRQAVPKDADHRCYTWQWDQNLEQPTLTPSFNCVAEVDGRKAGCGWHGHITAGVMR